MTVAQRSLEHQAVSNELRAQWNAHDLVPLWESANSDFAEPSEQPRHWKWSDVRPVLAETVKIGLPSIVERRVMQLINRSAGGPGADTTAGLMNGTMQGLMPGEHARPHRHSMSALRFVLEGAGAVTTVNGKNCAMETGDLITTPAWTWHEHRHEGTAPTFWLDILDVYLHRVLGTAAFQPGPIRDAAVAYDDAAFATANILPVIEGTPSFGDSPVFRYPWADAIRALGSTPRRSDGSRLVRYANPLTGGPCMELIDCYVLELPQGCVTDELRSHGNAIVSVVEGEGHSQIGDTRVEWSAKDTITIPRHEAVSHRASGPARLFIASNHDVYRRLGLDAE